MKDIATVCSQDASVFDEVSVLSPPHPQNAELLNACQPDALGRLQRHDPSSVHYSLLFSEDCPEKIVSDLMSSEFSWSPLSGKVYARPATVSPPSRAFYSSASAVRSGSGSPPAKRFYSPTSVNPESPSQGFYSPNSVSPESPGQGFYSPSSVNPESPSNSFYPPTLINPESPIKGFYSSNSVSPESPSHLFYSPTSINPESPPKGFYSPNSVKPESPCQGFYSSNSVNPESPNQGFYSPSSVNPESPNQGFYSPSSVNPESPSNAFYPPASSSSSVGLVSPSPTAGFMSSQSPVSATFLHSSSLSSMLSHTPSPSASFTSSPSPEETSPSVPFTPSPVLSPPEASPLSPPVTIKTEVDTSSCMSDGSPQPQPLQPFSMASQEVPLHPPHLGGLRSASPGKTVSGSLLPPCKICLDKASGFHYGLNTCEACKGFFRRSLKRGMSYVCARSGNCDVTGEKRNMCGYCRYQKCIALGMSKKAIKTGRYTHAKRTKDTLEIKRLMGEESAAEEEEMDFDSVIAEVVKAHDDFVISSTKVSPSIIHEKQLLKLEEINLNMKHFGKMTQVSPDEHQEIYNMTGIDIDNRRELMKFHVKNSERWIRGYISFAKKLPGFRELTLADQANLVKYARIEFWFLGSYPGYNADLGVAVMPNGRCFTRREMCNVWKTKYIDVSFDLSRRLQKLQVTAEEMIMVKAICLSAGDRCSFEDPDKVSKIQWRMIRCLQYLLQRRCESHQQFVSIFSKVFMCLTDLRDLNEAEYQTIQSTQLYQLFTAHPLIMEMLPY